MPTINKRTLIAFISLLLVIALAIGRSTAPKPAPEIKYITDTTAVQKAIKTTRQEIQTEFKKHVVLEKHSVKLASGGVKTDEKTEITYDKKTNEHKNIAAVVNGKINTNEKLVTHNANSNGISNGINYTFLIGRSFDDPKLDYMGVVGIPITSGIIANVAYEWNNKTVFAGVTLRF